MNAPPPPLPPPRSSATSGLQWLFRPIFILPLVVACVVLVALVTPEYVNARNGDPRLSSFSAAPLGASALYELGGRLGWQTSRRLTPMPGATDTAAIQALLAPPIAPSGAELHALLDVVRRGGAALIVLAPGITDSLHVMLGPGRSYRARLDSADSIAAQRCPKNVPPGLPLWFGHAPVLNSLRATRPLPRDTVVFASIEGDGSVRWESAAVGIPYGRGRLGLIADPDLLRNDVVRVCDWNADVVAVRMLEWLSIGDGFQRSSIRFDEYHQGFGATPGTMRGIALYLGRTPSGHVLAQVAVAGVLLLLSVGPRSLPPRAEQRVERRSPFEHVDALARAYAQVGATRTGTARLLHGVRRRLRGLGRSRRDETDDEFLARAERITPSLAADVELVRRALNRSVAKREFEGIGSALRRIESSLSSSTS